MSSSTPAAGSSKSKASVKPIARRPARRAARLRAPWWPPACPTGPDGRRYAVGGSVSIDTAPVKGDPEATIRKAQQIKAAASAPSDPSGQDRRVAAQADALRQQAEAELRAERREESEAATGASGGTDPEAGGEPADGFTRAAFSEAAARYRGDPEGPRVFSIAV